jgi:hypothetical protein
MKNMKWRCRLPLAYFGLNDAYMKQVYEIMFLLSYRAKISLTESYNLPVRARQFMFSTLREQLEREAEAHKSKT